MTSSNDLLPSDSLIAELSEAYDRLGPGEELQREAGRLGISESDADRLISDWQAVTVRLKQMKPGSVDLVESTIQQLSPQEFTKPVSASGVSASVRSRRHQIARLIAVATSAVAMLYVSLYIATDKESLNKSAQVLASFSFDPQGWDVVVVTVSDEQADRLSQNLGVSSDLSDLTALPYMENQSTGGDRFDVVMTSKATSQKLLGKLVDVQLNEMAEWNPETVDDMQREELLRRFGESMETPTRSDLYFGEVIVVTSGGDEGILGTTRASLPENSESLASTKASQANRRGTALQQLESDAILNHLQNDDQRPVLVVLKRKSTKPPSQGSTGIRDGGFAVYL